MFRRERILERIYPEFSDEEYEKRYRKAKNAMEKNGIDALFVTEKENIEYWTGFMCGHWMVKGFPPAVGIIPREGEPVLVLPSFLSGTAERTAWVRKMRLHAYTQIKPRGFANVVAETIKEMGLEKGVIGYESGEELHVNIPIVDFEKIRRDLPNCKFVSGGDIIWECRTIKSLLEIERLEKAASITIKGYEKARETIKDGMTEIEIAKIFKRIFVEECADGHAPDGLGFFNIRAGPERYPMADCLPSDRKVRKGDILVMNIGTSYRVYKSNTARYAVLGQPCKKHKEIHESILDAWNAGIDHLRPGLKGEEVHKYINGVLSKSSLGETCSFSGIGIGLNVHEPPTIGIGREDIIKSSMVITLMIWVYDVGTGGLGVFPLEHGLVVTERGNRLLVPFEEKELWVI